MLHSPILIIGCARSGTTLLYNILSEVPSLWSIGYESKAIIEQHHHPRIKKWDSGALDASDLTPASRAAILRAFEEQAAPGRFWRRVNQWRARLRSMSLWRQIKQRGRSTDFASFTSSALPQQGLDAIRAFICWQNRLFPRSGVSKRLLEKTPENCLRLPFLLALFPDARVIYLARDGRANVNSLLEGWLQPHLFPGYPVPERLNIPGYSRNRWAFTLIPDWRELTSSPLEEICAYQWLRCNEAVLAHQEETQGKVPYLTVRYEELIAGPAAVLSEIAAFIGVNFERDLAHFAAHLPQINVVSSPDPHKWQHNEERIHRILPLITPLMHRLGYDM